MDLQTAIQLAETRWPALQFTEKNHHEASAACPFCSQVDEDGFLVFEDGGYWCRQCDSKGWLNDKRREMTTEELTEIRLRCLERQQQEQETRIQALERMAQCHDHENYHETAINSTTAMEWFISQGLQPWAVFDYKMGACSRCPTDKKGRPSYTFPIWRKDGPLWSIRHRIIGPDDGGKYRPHRRNLGRQLVNARFLADWSERVIVVEGTKKARVIQQYDFPVVGILGKTGFEDRWLSWFRPTAAIYIALDPDAQEQADKLAHGIAKQGKRVHVAKFPMKPDDLFIAGATAEEWAGYIELARRVH